jgi:hypothetical protein
MKPHETHIWLVFLGVIRIYELIINHYQQLNKSTTSPTHLCPRDWWLADAPGGWASLSGGGNADVSGVVVVSHCFKQDEIVNATKTLDRGDTPNKAKMSELKPVHQITTYHSLASKQTMLRTHGQSPLLHRHTIAQQTVLNRNWSIRCSPVIALYWKRRQNPAGPAGHCECKPPKSWRLYILHGLYVTIYCIYIIIKSII